MIFGKGTSANDNDDDGGDALVSDLALDALAEAELAWERWERARHWWASGAIDDATGAVWSIRSAG